MDLILWRHAHAGDHLADPVEDLARPLSPKGERQAARMAQWLNQRLTESTRIIVSPAVRTQQTAQALGRAFKIVDALAPGSTVDELLLATRFPHARQAMLVVGHQPLLGLVVARLLEATDPSQSWSIRKGAIWWLRWEEREGRRLGVTLHAVISPDMV